MVQIAFYTPAEVLFSTTANSNRARQRTCIFCRRGSFKEKQGLHVALRKPLSWAPSEVTRIPAPFKEALSRGQEKRVSDAQVVMHLTVDDVRAPSTHVKGTCEGSHEDSLPTSALNRDPKGKEMLDERCDVVLLSQTTGRRVETNHLTTIKSGCSC
jgi:hypothetical protein